MLAQWAGSFGRRRLIAGLAASYYSDLPSGPAIIIVQTILFIAMYLLSRQFRLAS